MLQEQQSPEAVADSAFGDAYIDVDQWRETPVRHHYVHGGFAGTQTRFSFYLPPAEAYQGRFFQHITPVPQSEHLAQTAVGEEDKISFSIASGGYYVETNGGGNTHIAGTMGDPTIGAYRANAAAARYSRQVARDMYGERRVYGYCYGGSGGAFRTIGGAENTQGVWDGFVPFVPGSPMSLPNVFSVRMHAQRVLEEKLAQIADAVEPGGSGDPFAGLTEEEAAALTEVTKMGFPPRSWYAHQTMGTQAFSVIFPPLQLIDPGYFTDFWTVTGYLGADPASSVHAARITHTTTAAGALTIDDPALAAHLPARQGQPAGGVDESWQAAHRSEVAAIRLATPAPINTQGAELYVRSGAAASARLMLRKVHDDLAVLDAGNDPEALAKIRPGDEVVIDNSNVLAAQTYHRHQVPQDPDFTVWDQFRGPDGTPLYPQRPLVGLLMAAGAAGSVPSGRFTGKMIMVASLLDREAYPWQADWYRRKVTGHLGEHANEHYRLWYTDNAVHGDEILADDPRHAVSYIGVLHHALRDLANWVENGIEPPATTRYQIVDGQVLIPATAAERCGVQPTVELRADGQQRVDVPAGSTVTFHATAHTPAGTGKFVSIEWDLDDDANFAVRHSVEPTGSVDVEHTHHYDSPGTRFVTVRITTQREADPHTCFARVANIARVRVVVS